MSDHLRCDLNQLTEAGRQLDTIGRQFQQAGDIADDARAAVGHAGLAAKLDHFAQGWRVRRQDLLEDMTHLAELTKEAARTYRQVDQDLAAALQESSR